MISSEIKLCNGLCTFLPFLSPQAILTVDCSFWHGSGAPYQGQVNHFSRAAPEKIPYAITRFRNETLRVFGVLEIHLSGKYTGEPREYLAGKGKGKYSVADVKTWYVSTHAVI